ncbi:hypothetical protein BDZ94DRAFT_639244 [Collybia nuda]|uniref:Uncharacterized protein n=1 Tax=Collybia nuda TaxID=64659 RepID=A0A9P5Y7G3_9AGAR|nr:hypothetical protein BDZ94DRAFT_639244 [Collybia nuda]
MQPFILGLDTGSATTATCGPNFGWTKNSRNVPPCRLVENLLSAFSPEKAWKIQPLADGLYYSQPTSEKSEINKCACWAVYNLVSACAVCQGFSNAIPSWPVYSVQCDVTTDILLPSTTMADSEDIAVPFWAATNPKIWSFQRFNATQAEEIANQREQDFLPSGHVADGNPPLVPVVGILCALTLAALLGIGLYLLALIRQGVSYI